MKVVINSAVRNFELSKLGHAQAELRGLKIPDVKTAGGVAARGRLYESQEFRTNPDLVEIVENFGRKAGAAGAWLKVVEIPFDTLDGWHIHHQGEYEMIRENHRIWS